MLIIQSPLETFIFKRKRNVSGTISGTVVLNNHAIGPARLASNGLECGFKEPFTVENGNDCDESTHVTLSIRRRVSATLCTCSRLRHRADGKLMPHGLSRQLTSFRFRAVNASACPSYAGRLLSG